MGVIEGARIAGSRVRPWESVGPPTSGPSGTLADVAEANDMLVDVSNGVVFVNEGTQASPYWTPVGYDQAPLWGTHTDFRDQAGKAIANTDADAVLAGSGLRIFGQGIDETDSGLVVQSAAEGGHVGRLITTDEAEHLAAIGMEAGVMQPDQHRLLVIDVELAHVTDIASRAMFVGFLGTAADALDPAVTGSGTTATLVQDDLAGLWFDDGNTDAARLFGVHNKSDEAATQDLSADGDTSTDIASAGTFQRIRVEIDSSGAMTAFVDKSQVYTNGSALDTDEECSPVAYVESQTTSTKSMDVRRIAAYAYRA